MLQKVGRALDAALDDTLNARGRSAAHVAGGLVLVAGAMLASAVVAYMEGSSEANPKERARLDSLEKPPFQPSKKSFSAVWPPMFLLLTLSAVRIWNAPSSPARSRALGVWFGIQVMHAVTMAVGVKHQTAQLIANVATMLGGLAYAREAKDVDPPSAAIITPYVSWMAFGNLIAAELWRRNVGKHGVD